MIFALAIFAAETNTDIVAAVGGTGFVGIIAWVLKSALPSLMDKFGEFLDKQNASAKEEREAAKEEREALRAAHAEQMKQMRDDSQMMNRNFATLTSAVADLAAEVRSMRAVVGEPHVEVAPPPKPASGRQRQLPPGTNRGE